MVPQVAEGVPELKGPKQVRFKAEFLRDMGATPGCDACRLGGNRNHIKACKERQEKYKQERAAKEFETLMEGEESRRGAETTDQLPFINGKKHV